MMNAMRGRCIEKSLKYSERWNILSVQEKLIDLNQAETQNYCQWIATDNDGGKIKQRIDPWQYDTGAQSCRQIVMLAGVMDLVERRKDRICVEEAMLYEKQEVDNQECGDPTCHTVEFPE